jgi:hypothetical protein
LCAIEQVDEWAKHLPASRPKDYSKRWLIRDIVYAFQNQLGLRPTTARERHTKFERVLQRIFHFLQESHGVTGTSRDTIHNLAVDVIASLPVSAKPDPENT